MCSLGLSRHRLIPSCPCVPVPASTVSGRFLGVIPLVSHGMLQLESLECLCVAWLEVFNLPVPEHRAQTCATQSTEATCVSKELLEDLLYLPPGREPRILFYFLSYLCF